MIKLGWLIIGIIIGAYLQHNGIGSEYLPMAGEHAVNLIRWVAQTVLDTVNA
jgi:hypothetical protein